MKFNFDTIDETDILEETLKPRVDSLGGTLEKVQLSGNHITPCIQVKLLCILLLSNILFITVKHFPSLVESASLSYHDSDFIQQIADYIISTSKKNFSRKNQN